METIVFFESHWLVISIIAAVVIACLASPSVHSEDFFVLDDEASDEEKEIFRRRSELLEEKSIMLDTRPEEYIRDYLNETNRSVSEKELNRVEREEILQRFEKERKQLYKEISKVTDAFIILKEKRILEQKIREADALEAQANKIIEANPNNAHALTNAKKMVKKAKRIRRNYS